MRKLKIYVDTSVVSLFDDSERGIVTKKFFDIVARENDNFEIILSPVLADELDEASHEHRKRFTNF
jgi:hypothetical protein